MLKEYSLIPDIFDASCYSPPDLCNTELKHIKDVFLEEALVRNLNDGEWLNFLASCCQQEEFAWPSRSKELLKKLIKKRRLYSYKAVTQNVCKDYKDWCNEAIASHEIDPLNGIITTEKISEYFKEKAEVSAITKLSSTAWWNQRSPSIRLHRTTHDYIQVLRLVLTHSNSIMFIDPHLDPVRYNYREFFRLIEIIGQNNCSSKIEIHRLSYFGSGPTKQEISQEEMQKGFQQKLSNLVSDYDLKIKVFAWDYLHDRHLISDLIGITLGNGFDIGDSPSETTIWARLGRDDKDKIQREFDPASGEHKLLYDFMV